jgi:hypothetical protein
VKALIKIRRRSTDTPKRETVEGFRDWSIDGAFVKFEFPKKTVLFPAEIIYSLEIE